MHIIRSLVILYNFYRVRNKKLQIQRNHCFLIGINKPFMAKCNVRNGIIFLADVINSVNLFQEIDETWDCT